MRKGEMSIQKMKAPSHSLQRLWFGGYDANPYINLANAIVSVAADDYRTALKENNSELRENLEQFFHSKWYTILTKVDPDIILRGLRSEFTKNTSVVIK